MILKFSVQSLPRKAGSIARFLVLTAIVGGAAPAALAQTSFSQLPFDGTTPVSYAQVSPSGSALRARVDAVPGVALGEGAIATDIGTGTASANQIRTWASGFGFTSRVGADARGPGFKTDGGGVSAGIDRFFSPTFLAGVAFTYSHSETTSLGARGKSDAISGSVYAAWTPYAGWEAEGLVGIDSAGIDTTRVLAFGGIPVTTRGETDSLGFSAAGTVGYRFRFAAPLGEAFLKPFAGLSYSSQDRDGYAEIGAFGPGLVFPSQTFARSTFNLGAATGIDLNAGNGWIVRPELRVAWSRFLTDPSPPVPAFFGDTPIVLRDRSLDATGRSSPSRSRERLPDCNSSPAMRASSAPTPRLIKGGSACASAGRDAANRARLSSGETFLTGQEP